PSTLSLDLTAGTSQTFAVATHDPDGDPVAVNWLLDGNPVATGTSFDYSPVAGDVGLHVVRAVSRDSSPLGGAVTVDWVVAVLLPDADSDGWNANVDCDEADPA